MDVTFQSRTVVPVRSPSGLVLAWLLTWARTYVWPGSASDRRRLARPTYSHMQSLSLEFFGGKRTGDLISRVSTDTDRICYFFSVYVLDFANDVLMLVLIAGLIFILNPRLALATLLPDAVDRIFG